MGKMFLSNPLVPQTYKKDKIIKQRERKANKNHLKSQNQYVWHLQSEIKEAKNLTKGREKA